MGLICAIKNELLFLLHDFGYDYVAVISISQRYLTSDPQMLPGTFGWQ